MIEGVEGEVEDSDRKRWRECLERSSRNGVSVDISNMLPHQNALLLLFVMRSRSSCCFCGRWTSLQAFDVDFNSSERPVHSLTDACLSRLSKASGREDVVDSRLASLLSAG